MRILGTPFCSLSIPLSCELQGQIACSATIHTSFLPLLLKFRFSNSQIIYLLRDYFALSNEKSLVRCQIFFCLHPKLVDLFCFLYLELALSLFQLRDLDTVSHKRESYSLLLARSSAKIVSKKTRFIEGGNHHAMVQSQGSDVEGHSPEDQD